MSHGAQAIAAATMDRPFADVDNKKLGMWLFLGSDAMGFTGLLGAYAVLRMSASTWIPAKTSTGEPFDLNATAILTGFNTFLLICSSVTMVLALKNLRHGNAGKFKGFLFATMMGGVGFLTIQAFEWTHLIHSGITAPSSLFGGTFFILTGYHGFHVLGGVCLLAWALVRAMKGVYTADNFVGIEVVGLYWHFVDLVWIILFTLIYLIQG
jgi:heme/copper-type cytochrome/quinol oxidase subunit 3